MDLHTFLLKTLNTRFSNRITSKGSEEVHRPIQQLCQLNSNHGASTRRLLKTLLSMTNAARLRPLIHRKKLDPFDVTNNG
jgi:hypothetical protein